MPIVAYAPNWDVIQAFYERVGKLIPPDYSGMIGIRLHRTGNPLALEIYGPQLPDEPLAPSVFLKIEGGEPAESWDRIVLDFTVPWAREEDFHHYRVDVMAYYHGEDLLEDAAEAILQEDSPGEQALRAVIRDHAQVFAGP